jgi:hypothetical protein
MSVAHLIKSTNTPRPRLPLTDNFINDDDDDVAVAVVVVARAVVVAAAEATPSRRRPAGALRPVPFNRWRDSGDCTNSSSGIQIITSARVVCGDGDEMGEPKHVLTCASSPAPRVHLFR